jgi:hypothetical protein
MEKNEILGFEYKNVFMHSFEIIGFTKIVQSGGELYDEIRNGEKWDILKKMNIKDKTIYGIASLDKDCPEHFYRYTMGIKKDDGYLINEKHKNELFSFQVKESNWIVFSLDFSTDYGKLWGSDPYKIIKDIGYNFNNSLGIHIDVFREDYDGHEMEFWMPIKK